MSSFPDICADSCFFQFRCHPPGIPLNVKHSCLHHIILSGLHHERLFKAPPSFRTSLSRFLAFPLKANASVCTTYCFLPAALFTGSITVSTAAADTFCSFTTTGSAPEPEPLCSRSYRSSPYLRMISQIPADDTSHPKCISS